MYFYCATHVTNDNRKSNATQNPKQEYLFQESNVDKRVYQTNFCRSRIKKIGVDTLHVYDQQAIRREPNGPKD